MSDVDRATQLYQRLGWRLDADIVRCDAFQVVQLTPLHSARPVAFERGLTTAEPGAAQRLLLVVSDIAQARRDRIRRGRKARVRKSLKACGDGWDLGDVQLQWEHPLA